MKMNPKQWNSLKTRIEEKTQVISHPTSVYETVDIGVSGFPRQLFIEWQKDVAARFNDIRHLKIWNDHIKAKAYDAMIAVMEAKVEKVPESQAQETEEESL